MVCSSLCLSVWHVHCIVLKRQTISTRFLLLMSAPMSLPDRVKIWFTSVDPFFPKFYPKVTHPVDLGVRDIRQQIVAEWLEIAHWSQWYNHWSLYPYTRPLLPPKWRLLCIPAMSSFAKLLWPLLIITPVEHAGSLFELIRLTIRFK